MLETLDFKPNKDKGFWCIDGGVQKIAKLMSQKIENPVQFNTQVTAIDANIKQRGDGSHYAPLTVKYTKTDPTTKKQTEGSNDYFTVFNSTTLGALQRMDLQDAGLL